MILLDTCVLIDIQRRYPAALAWLKRHERMQTALSAVSVFEVSIGADRLDDARTLQAMIDSMVVIAVDQPIAWQAGSLRRRYATSHGLSPLDALIAATAQVSGLPLITLNTKHFPMFSDLERPY